MSKRSESRAAREGESKKGTFSEREEPTSNARVLLKPVEKEEDDTVSIGAMMEKNRG
jgi:hypothetical protein